MVREIKSLEVWRKLQTSSPQPHHHTTVIPIKPPLNHTISPNHHHTTSHHTTSHHTTSPHNTTTPHHTIPPHHTTPHHITPHHTTGNEWHRRLGCVEEVSLYEVSHLSSRLLWKPHGHRHGHRLAGLRRRQVSLLPASCFDPFIYNLIFKKFQNVYYFFFSKGSLQSFFPLKLFFP